MMTLEVTANCITLVSVYLARKNSIHTWWVGIIGCILFCVLFFDVKLYADMMLQLYFIGTCMYGWWNWSQGGDDNEILKISSLPNRKIFQYSLISLVLSGVYGGSLYYFTDASSPFMDSALLIFSMLAQFLLMSRKYQTWMFWIVVNLISVPLYVSQDLVLTAALYAIFFLNAVWGFTTWKKLLETSQAIAPEPEPA